jgi:transcriptional regulator with XRE-family HTH domain
MTARALRWLRHRARLTQGEVRDAVIAGGGAISVIYIQQLEAGRKQPSPAMLDALLAALGSDRGELAEVCELDRAHDAPSGGWQPGRHDPVRATVAQAMAERATWSDEVVADAMPSPAADAPPPLAGGLAELTDHYLSLGPAQRLVVLEAARLARYGARRPG